VKQNIYTLWGNIYTLWGLIYILYGVDSTINPDQEHIYFMGSKHSDPDQEYLYFIGSETQYFMGSKTLYSLYGVGNASVILMKNKYIS